MVNTWVNESQHHMQTVSEVRTVLMSVAKNVLNSTMKWTISVVRTVYLQSMQMTSRVHAVRVGCAVRMLNLYFHAIRLTRTRGSDTDHL